MLEGSGYVDGWMEEGRDGMGRKRNEWMGWMGGWVDGYRDR